MFTHEEEWHEKRRGGIGGSDCAAALGVSRYKTPYQLWLEKIGRAERQEKTWEMARGIAMEPLLRQHYADVTGNAVILPNHSLRHPSIEYMLYNADGVLPDVGKLVEFKTAAYGDGWGDDGSDQIPLEYLLQVQHGMAVTGYAATDVMVSIAGNKPRLFEVLADAELQGMIIERERIFWGYVMRGESPPPESNDDAAHMFSDCQADSVVLATEEIEQSVKLLHQARKAIDDTQAQRERLEVAVKCYMGANDTLLARDGLTKLCTWRAQKSKNSESGTIRKFLLK